MQSLQIQQLQSFQYLHSLAPSTLLPIELAAPLLYKKATTLQNDITRRPELLPTITRIGGRVFFLKSDIDQFIANSRVVYQAPIVKKRGRPTKAESVAKREAVAQAGCVA
jgi:hypothetical protein